MGWGVAKPFTCTSNKLLADMGWGGGVGQQRSLGIQRSCESDMGWGWGGGVGCGKTVHQDFKQVTTGVWQNRSLGLQRSC